MLMIVVDMDGTLVGSDGRVSERNLAAMKAAEKAGVEVVVGGVQLFGPVQRDHPDGAGVADEELVGKVVVGHEIGNSRIRLAMRLRWICDVPPMTLWARL